MRSAVRRTIGADAMASSARSKDIFLTTDEFDVPDARGILRELCYSILYRVCHLPGVGIDASFLAPSSLSLSLSLSICKGQSF